VIVVPFTVTYALNTDFTNGSEAYQHWMANAQATVNASATATQQVEASTVQVARSNKVMIGLLVGVVLLIIVWLAWRGVVRS